MLQRYRFSPRSSNVSLSAAQRLMPSISSRSNGYSTMSLIHWQPWQEIETLSRQIDRLFNDLAPVSRDANAVTTTWTPAIELKATDAAFVLRAALPGMAAKDLDIQVTREAVSIAGNYHAETHEDGTFRSEFRYGSFRRVIPLPVAIQNDQVKADFTDGILTLTLPKVVNDRPTVVKVNLTDATTEPKLETHSDRAPAASETAQTAPQSDDVWAEKAA